MYTITEGKTTFTGETREEAEAMRDRIKAHHARLELAYSEPASGTSVPMSNAERPDTSVTVELRCDDDHKTIDAILARHQVNVEEEWERRELTIILATGEDARRAKLLLAKFLAPARLTSR